MTNSSTIQKELSEINAIAKMLQEKSSRLMSKLSGREGNGSSPALKKVASEELRARVRAKRDRHLQKRLNK